ncbi:MAG TPA: ABC-F family ATP-binding cassette domain-containing protein, partial [Chloroflexota bacterium]|nr:ABC-F family ATP-binding cassette domain-containing protein [Chloroflexota bacterium]
MLRFLNVSKSYGATPALTDVTFTIKDGEKVGLVGPNGAGKTTLLRLAVGGEDFEPDSGRVHRPHTIDVGYLPQDAGCRSNLPLWDEMMSAFPELNAVGIELRLVEEGMAEASTDELTDLIERQSDLLEDFERLGGYTVEAEIHQVLAGLGFTAEDHQKLALDFSGGWQMRIALAKLLIQRRGLLLLDEPTNHLDTAAIEWLKGYLVSHPASALIVSHDHAFLDAVTTRTIEIADTRAVDYRGNYSYFLAEREKRRKAQQASYDRYVKFIASQKESIERFKANAKRAAQARSRERALAKLPVVEPPAAGPDKLRLRFAERRAPANEVLVLENVRKSFDGQPVLDGINLRMTGADRVALIGPNGAGKSTILKIIAGLIPADGGVVSLGDNVVAGYFAQDQSQVLDETRTAIEELRHTVRTTDLGGREWSEEALRALLGRFRFSQDAAKKLIAGLSGGERSRLSLAKLLLRNVNLLLLDEPTNHLDIQTKESIEEAITSFGGAVLIASHDPYLLDRVVTRVGILESGRLELHTGTFADYRARMDDEIEEEFVEDYVVEEAGQTEAERALAAIDAELEVLNARRSDLS